MLLCTITKVINKEVITINKRFLQEVSRILDVYGPTALVLIEAIHVFHEREMPARAQLAIEQMDKIQTELMSQLRFLIYKYNIKASLKEIIQAVGPHIMRLNFGIGEPGFSQSSTPVSKQENPFEGLDTEEVN